MRFGISATSWIFPKNLRTRFRPVNVCAISSLALSNRRARDDSPEGRHPSRPSGQASGPVFSRFGGQPNRASLPPLGADKDDSEEFHPESPNFVSTIPELGPFAANASDRARATCPVRFRSEGQVAVTSAAVHLSSTLAPAFSSWPLTFSA